MKDKNKLTVIDGETLADLRLPPTRFCMQTLLPQGVTILGGAPKIGKSWMVLELCVRVAKGEAMWGMATTQGTTLYLCLEDTLRRVQERMLCITDEVPANAFFATAAETLADGLCEQIRQFTAEHPDTVLVAIDTFQMVRGGDTELSYANDYAEVQKMKKLADDLNISLLLVHHLRKQGDSDPLNKLSGTTGISGAVDAVFVLDKDKRGHSGATLICTGRDIEYRELLLKFSSESCTWELVQDSMDAPTLLLPKELAVFVEFMRNIRSYHGGNSELVERFHAYSGETISAKSLKQLMNKWRYQLEEQGICFQSHRSNGQRLIDISFSALDGDASDSSAAEIGGATTCVPCDPCVPALEPTPNHAPFPPLSPRVPL